MFPGNEPKHWVNRDAKLITYVTDVEGHWPYFCNFVQLSEGLSFAEPGRYHESAKVPELTLQDGWHFVHGGDALDKGPGAIRLVTALTALKQKYPDRVHLIMGNRDINKMRFTSELHTTYLKQLSQKTPAAHWVAPKQQTTPWAYLTGVAARQRGIPESEVTPDMVSEENSVCNRIQYHLKHDMGADGEFEFRRQELALLSGQTANDIGDDEVTESYIESVQEGGFLREYLKLGVLAVLLGNTLIVHGNIIGEEYLGFQGIHWSVQVVPDAIVPKGYRKVEKLEEWIVELNTWMMSQVQEWISQSTFNWHPTEPTFESWSGRGGAALMAYSTFDVQVPSVVYTRWLTKENMPRQYPEDLCEYLKGQGVSRVVVGHTPHGVCPTIIPHESTGLTVVMGDTGFSNMMSQLWFQGDHRGDAISVVAIKDDDCLIKGRTGMSQVARGRFAASEFSEIIDYKVAKSGGDTFVGKMQPLVEDAEKTNGQDELDFLRFFVKARIHSPAEIGKARYLLCNVSGFKNTYQEVDETFVRERFNQYLTRDVSRTTCITSHGKDFGHNTAGEDNDLLKFLFTDLDLDKSGKVSISGLLAALADREVRDAMAWYFPDQTLEQAFNDMDSNKDGMITQEEFEKALVFRKEELKSRPRRSRRSSRKKSETILAKARSKGSLPPMAVGVNVSDPTASRESSRCTRHSCAIQ